MKIRKRRDGSAKRLRIGLNGCFFPFCLGYKEGSDRGPNKKKKKNMGEKEVG